MDRSKKKEIIFMDNKRIMIKNLYEISITSQEDNNESIRYRSRKERI